MSLTYNKALFTVRRGGTDPPIPLTVMQAQIIDLCLQKNLASDCGAAVVSRREIGRALYGLEVSGYKDSLQASIDAAIGGLRKRIEPDPRRPIYLVTVRGHGILLQNAGYETN